MGQGRHVVIHDVIHDDNEMGNTPISRAPQARVSRRREMLSPSSMQSSVLAITNPPCSAVSAIAELLVQFGG